ncbi:hypothetical protein G7K_4013-t1 [Saitoella complicata NRRL Y-17804]|uniref:Uncharacterized protein n=1 Tax=Saitoella complicata (strain BCRC 22490 / CBS 7301 / JCM 7358 / NBRC 10748 / NRRL Y-17804) TaxID=698492 RepID=A0A0E9NJM3_SAICN|nr:hypothetical protein G7K_4013-t1 [Saitoella complicata NRRL Y-17804]
MAPPTHHFPVTVIDHFADPIHLEALKDPSACPLHVLTQYKCRVTPTTIVCGPLDRYFRLCRDKQGRNRSVEVTWMMQKGWKALEDKYAGCVR